MATLSVSPTSGIFGTSLTLTGLGFLPTTVITIRYGVRAEPDIITTVTGFIIAGLIYPILWYLIKRIKK